MGQLVYDEVTGDMVDVEELMVRERGKQKWIHRPMLGGPGPQQASTKHPPSMPTKHELTTAERKRGGVSRRLLLSKEERSGIARKAAQARWGKKHA
jgi:hypothetical protein